MKVVGQEKKRDLPEEALELGEEAWTAISNDVYLGGGRKET